MVLALGTRASCILVTSSVDGVVGDSSMDAAWARRAGAGAGGSGRGRPHGKPLRPHPGPEGSAARNAAAAMSAPPHTDDPRPTATTPAGATPATAPAPADRFNADDLEAAAPPYWTSSPPAATSSPRPWPHSKKRHAAHREQLAAVNRELWEAAGVINRYPDRLRKGHPSMTTTQDPQPGRPRSKNQSKALRAHKPSSNRNRPAIESGTSSQMAHRTLVRQCSRPHARGHHHRGRHRQARLQASARRTRRRAGPRRTSPYPP